MHEEEERGSETLTALREKRGLETGKGATIQSPQVL